jgi:hypothetical protein
MQILFTFPAKWVLAEISDHKAQRVFDFNGHAVFCSRDHDFWWDTKANKIRHSKTDDYSVWFLEMAPGIIQRACIAKDADECRQVLLRHGGQRIDEIVSNIKIGLIDLAATNERLASEADQRRKKLEDERREQKEILRQHDEAERQRNREALYQAEAAWAAGEQVKWEEIEAVCRHRGIRMAPKTKGHGRKFLVSMNRHGQAHTLANYLPNGIIHLRNQITEAIDGNK